MTNADINKKFLAVLEEKTRLVVLGAIAEHYGITPAEMYIELIDKDAEHILDHLTGVERTAVSVLYQQHGFNTQQS